MMSSRDWEEGVVQRLGARTIPIEDCATHARSLLTADLHSCLSHSTAVTITTRGGIEVLKVLTADF